MSHKPWIVYADRNMVNTILRNLLSNAIKYSHSGGRITIKMRATGEFIRTEIMDEGVGMDKETLARLFRIDQKISTPGTMKERGTGLGLILCREFVEKCGGSIQAKSEEGKGSAFIFTLPVNREP